MGQSPEAVQTPVDTGSRRQFIMICGNHDFGVGPEDFSLDSFFES